MPMPIQFGNIYETEYDAVVDGIVSPKPENMRDNNETNPSQLEQRKQETDLPIIWNVSDWYTKPSAPQVSKPNTNVEVTPQQRLEGAFKGVEMQDHLTYDNLKRRSEKEKTDAQSGWLHRISDKKETPGVYLGEIPYEGPEMIDNNSGVIMHPYGRRNSQDTIDQITDPNEIMKKYPNSEGFILKGNPYLFIRTPKEPPLTS